MSVHAGQAGLSRGKVETELLRIQVQGHALDVCTCVADRVRVVMCCWQINDQLKRLLTQLEDLDELKDGKDRL